MTNSQTLHTLEPQLFLDVIQERHSVRSYDPTVKIPREEMTEILELATLAPSSIDPAAMAFFSHRSAGVEAKASAHCLYEQQVVEASAIIAGAR